MSDYIRPRIPGASIFFTVALAARGSRLLVEEIDRLRSTVAAVRAERPFRVEAWVVLPDHMHAIWTLPEATRTIPSGGARSRRGSPCRCAGRTESRA